MEYLTALQGKVWPFSDVIDSGPRFAASFRRQQIGTQTSRRFFRRRGASGPWRDRDKI
jgi:hypothetical protein